MPARAAPRPEFRGDRPPDAPARAAGAPAAEVSAPLRASFASRGLASSRLTQCAAKWYEFRALRSDDAQPLRLAEAAPRRGAVTPARQVDELDRRIIEALQENGRESFRRIATRLGVSEATVRARYARLTSEGIVQVVAVTNPLGLGFDQALVGVKTSGPPGAVADEIARWPDADYVVVTAGQFDLVVEVVAADRHEMLEVTNRMRALAG